MRKQLTDAEYGYCVRIQDACIHLHGKPHKTIEHYEQAIESMPDKYRKKLVPMFEKHIKRQVSLIIDGS